MRQIVLGRHINYSKHLRMEFGTYVQVHDPHDNSTRSRTTGAINLGPTGNLQGTHFFMSLWTGRQLHRSNWTILPMPKEVIDQVHNLARQQNSGLHINT